METRRRAAAASGDAHAENGPSSSSLDPDCDPSLSASRAADPFCLQLGVERRDWPFIALGTVLLVPWRAVIIVLCLLMAWAVSAVGLVGIPKGQEALAPRAGWRRKIMDGPLALLSWIILVAGGFRVRFVGEQAPRREAPMLVGAPHSSFLEALFVVLFATSPVSRHENEDAFLISACQKFAQTIFVDRSASGLFKVFAGTLVTVLLFHHHPRHL